MSRKMTRAQLIQNTVNAAVYIQQDGKAAISGPFKEAHERVEGMMRTAEAIQKNMQQLFNDVFEKGLDETTAIAWLSEEIEIKYRGE